MGIGGEPRDETRLPIRDEATRIPSSSAEELRFYLEKGGAFASRALHNATSCRAQCNVDVELTARMKRPQRKPEFQLLAERLPIDLPELRHRRPQLEMPAEALEARFVGEPFGDVVHEFLEGLRARIADGEAAVAAAFLATHVDVENGH